MADNDLARLPAVELARRVRARELSPVEVLDACLERVERLNGTLNAVVTLNPRVREEARGPGYTEIWCINSTSTLQEIRS